MALADRLPPGVVALVSVASLGMARPTLTMQAGGELHLSELPAILEDEKVAPELTKGLTTTFLFRVDVLDGRSGREAGGGRVEIRYELWDEVFHLSIVGIDGRARREQVDSMEALQAWWSALRLMS